MTEFLVILGFSIIVGNLSGIGVLLAMGQTVFPQVLYVSLVGIIVAIVGFIGIW